MAFASVSGHFTVGQPVNPVRSLSVPRGPTLADDSTLYASPNGWVDRTADSDYESWTWPEEVDQTRIGNIGFTRFADDDMELDDGV